jgi:FlaA1/EpsC-like NDP-sugar epimerase
MFKNKVLLIFGGTGSFGSFVLRRFLTIDKDQDKTFVTEYSREKNMTKMACHILTMI